MLVSEKIMQNSNFCLQASLSDFYDSWWVGRSLHQYSKYTLFFVRNSILPPSGAPPGFTPFRPEILCKIPENWPSWHYYISVNTKTKCLMQWYTGRFEIFLSNVIGIDVRYCGLSRAGNSNILAFCQLVIFAKFTHLSLPITHKKTLSF